MRNYAVLHIVADEARIFKTKERCPLLLCIEVYRPTEIALEKIPEVLTVTGTTAHAQKRIDEIAALRSKGPVKKSNGVAA